MALVGSVLALRFPLDPKWWHGEIVEHDASDESAKVYFKDDGEELWFSLDVEHGKAREVLQGGRLGQAQACRFADSGAEVASSAAARPEAQRAPAAASAPRRAVAASAKDKPTASKQQRKRAVVPSSQPASTPLPSASREPSGADSNETKRPRREAASKAISALTAESSEDSDFESSADELDDEVQSGRGARGKRARATKAGAKKAASGNAKKRAAQSSDEEYDESGSDDDSEDDDGDDDDYEDEEGGPRRSSAKAKGKAKAAKNAAGNKEGDARSMTKEDRAAELVELQAIWANPPPQRLKVAEKPGYSEEREKKSHRGVRQFLDTPFDITDRGVVHIVKEQARRLQPLVEQALQKKTPAAGGLPPVHLQTVCSGTDAPALALRIISNELAEKGTSLQVDHALSCENEPFKQAYIARNFPGVALFNDVVELASKAAEAKSSKVEGKASTSFGGERTIPRAPAGHQVLSVLIAGTSCKDFSARKRATGIKLDIEDMGTSGETFVATIDYLFARAHDICLLENVTSAPWAKMVGYITGRVALQDVFSKIQSSAKSQGEKVVDTTKKGVIAETLLELEKGDKLVVSQVFPQHGLRLGAVLSGWSTKADGDVSLDRTALRALGLKKGGTIELKQLCQELGLSLSDKFAALLFQMPVNYEATFMPVDSKFYGLPHTRNRKYLLAWKRGTYGKLPAEEVAACWKEMVKELQTPLDHPVEAFMLPDTSDRIRRFRDVLRSPIAQRLAEQQEGRDFYTTNRDANTRYFLGFRNCIHLLPKRDQTRDSVIDAAKNGANMQLDARPLTRWSPKCAPSFLSPYWMQDVLAFWSQHSLDHVEVKAIKNAEVGIDLLHHNALLDLSQNPHQTDIIPKAGITGCLTPGGQMYHFRRGREISGFEKLLLSGIPADQLLLGGESEVQLSDLAGNAMSMPVVSACILSAFCIAPYAAAKRAGDPKGGLLSPPSAAAAHTLPASSSKKKPAGAYRCFNFVHCMELAGRAEGCSVLCTCESSGDVSMHRILRCSCCQMTLCGMCAAHVQLDVHDMKPLFGETGRFALCDDPSAAPELLERELRCAVPDTLTLAQPMSGTGFGTEPLRLLRIERERDVMRVKYVAYGSDGASPVATLSVAFGRLGAAGAGIVATLYDLSTGKRGQLAPAARLILREGGAASDADQWEVCESRAATITCTPELGATSPSFRAAMGLLDFKDEVWADRIHVGGTAALLQGTYVRQDCRGTVAFGALWQRESDEGMWLFVDPDVNRTGPDRLVFATTPIYHDGTAHHVATVQLGSKEPVHEWLHTLGQAALAPVAKAAGKAAQKRPKTDGVIRVPVAMLHWTPAPSIQLMEEKGSVRVTQKAADHYPVYVVRGLAAGTLAKLREHAHDGQLSILAASSTAAERRLAETLAAPLLRFAFKEEGGIAKVREGQAAWGECTKSAPRRPLEKWASQRRVYDTEQSNAYEKAMNARPTAWEVRLSDEAREDSVEVVPRVEHVGHQAAERLLRGRNIGAASQVGLRVEWRVGTHFDARCEREFPIKSSKDEAPAGQPPAKVWAKDLELYPRQLKVLQWMQDIEAGYILFDERDYSDAALPAVGWQLQAKAGIHGPLRGGLLADALGAGKTVTVIALIAADVQAARALPLTDPHHSRATLIVVTPLIIRQWEVEIGRFTDKKLRCVRIESSTHLQALTYKELREADVVLIVSDLLGCASTGKATSFAATAGVKEAALRTSDQQKEAVRAKERLQGKSNDEVTQLVKSLDSRKDTYLDVMTEKAGTEGLPPFLHRRNTNREAGGGDVETMIYGVWITNSSRDPYGKTKGRQEVREAAAHFSHSYTRVALPALRAKAFGDGDVGVPIEYFRWRRVIVDECHEPLCMGADDADESAMSTKRSACAVRELLGIALPDIDAPPLLAQRGTFGLTGTPLLSSVARITELASLCAGTYVTGAWAHWRMIERASGRDLFLRYHDAVPSRLYQSETVRSAQAFVNAAARRNVVEEVIAYETAEERAQLRLGSEYERLCSKHPRVPLCPDRDAIEEPKWLQLAQAAADAEERGAALERCVERIVADEPLAKVLVFAPMSSYEAAARAVRALGLPAEVARPGEDQERTAELVLEFDEPPTELSVQQNKCRVLLLAYEDGAGLNLQHGCHHVVLYAPLASPPKDSEKVIAAVGKEQQSIGRVRRAGQKHKVHIYRIVLEGPSGEKTIDGLLHERNADEQLIRSATNTAD